MENIGKVTPEQQKLIKKLANDGYGGKEIATIVGITKNQYKYVSARLNVTVQRRSNSLRIIDGKFGQCSKCREIKTLDNFRIRQRYGNDPFYITYCYECQYKTHGIYVNADVQHYLADKWLALKSKCNKKQIPFSISKEQYIEQYFKQSGLCFYSDRKLVCKVLSGRKEKNQFSTDKIIPELGYIPGNVVFCIKQINICKNDLSLEDMKLWMPSWHERILKFLDENKKN